VKREAVITNERSNDLELIEFMKIKQDIKRIETEKLILIEK